MSLLVGLLEYGGIAVFGALGVAGVLQWHRRRDAAAGYLALTFALLAAVVLVASTPVYPEADQPGHIAASRILATALLAVPYLQYRFMAAFSPRRRGEEIAVGTAASLAVAGALLLPDFAPGGETHSAVFTAYLVAALAYWVTLALHVAVRLWRDGHPQPMVARMRMRTLAAGSLGLAAAVVMSAFVPAAETNAAGDALMMVLALAAGVTLLAGFAPPPALRGWWRRRQGAGHWQLARQLMAARTPLEVARFSVEHVSALFGGRGTALVQADGTPLATHGLDPTDARRLAAAAGASAADVLAVPCDGGWLLVQPSAYTPFFGEQEVQELAGVAALAELALGRVTLHEELHATNRRLTEAQSIARIGSWEWDVASDTLSWSDELYRLHGLTPRSGALRYDDALANVHPDDREVVDAAVRAAITSRRPFAVEHRVVHPDGAVLRLHAQGMVHGGQSGEPLRLLGACQDVTERRGLEEAVAHGAHHDPLTELPNRMLFTQRLWRALAHAERQKGSMAVLMIDLDDFAAVNDTLGPEAGDALLQGVAARLQSSVRAVDTVARIGADQFGVLLEDTQVRSTIELAERIRTELGRPLTVPGGRVGVKASIGITSGARSVSAGELLRNADAAMRAAKLAGKDGYRIFEDGMHEELSRRLALRADLPNAVPGDQLWLAYQPVVSMTDGAVLAVEALVRWQHPDRGLVKPSEFIPIAEDSGLILPIGQWVLQEALQQVAGWHATMPHLGQLGLHVNVSARELLDPQFVERFGAMLQASSMDPRLLTVEITESMLMGESNTSVKALGALRSLGVRVAIDDFGTGYSSLSYLRRLPVDTLKIDKAFIDGITEGPEDAALARAIIRIGHTLQLSVVAEGVETAAQANRLRAMGCGVAQGFHFSRPLAGEELADLMVAPAPDGAVAAS